MLCDKTQTLPENKLGGTWGNVLTTVFPGFRTSYGGCSSSTTDKQHIWGTCL